MLLLTPVADQYSVDVPRRARNVPPRLLVEAAEDVGVLNNPIPPTEHQFPDGLRQNRPGHTVESPEEGVRGILCTRRPNE